MKKYLIWDAQRARFLQTDHYPTAHHYAVMTGCAVVDLEAEAVMGLGASASAIAEARRIELKDEAFKEGDTVTWSSQAGSSRTTKVGVVIAVIPPKVRPPRQEFPTLYKGGVLGIERDHTSYVVKVKGKGLYWPRVNGLTRAAATGQQNAQKSAAAGTIEIGLQSTPKKLSELLGVTVNEVIKALFKMGVMATPTSIISHDAAALVAEDLGWKVKRKTATDQG